MPSEGSEYPLGDRRALPETITAGGVTRWLTRHLREEPDDGVAADRIQYALENWVVRGRDELLRVPVSLDDAEIITAHFDEHAAGRIVAGDRPWFQQRCRDLEVRDGS